MLYFNDPPPLSTTHTSQPPFRHTIMYVMQGPKIVTSASLWILSACISFPANYSQILTNFFLSIYYHLTPNRKHRHSLHYF